MKFEKLEKFREKVTYLSSSAIAYVSALSQREKIMLAVMVIALFVFVVGGSTLLIVDSLSNLEESIKEKGFKLKKINAEKSNYLAAKTELERVKAKLLNTERSCSLFKFLEDEAQKLTIELGDINKRGIVGDKAALILENQVELGIRNITLTKLADYLYQLESGSCLLKVTKLAVRARGNADDRKLSATFTVSQFTLNPEANKEPEKKPETAAPVPSPAKQPTSRPGPIKTMGPHKAGPPMPPPK